MKYKNDEIRGADKMLVKRKRTFFVLRYFLLIAIFVFCFNAFCYNKSDISCTEGQISPGNIIGFKSYCKTPGSCQFGSFIIKSNKHAVRLFGFKFRKWDYIITENSARLSKAFYVGKADGYGLYKDLLLFTGTVAQINDDTKYSNYYFLFRIKNNAVQFIDALQDPDLPILDFKNNTLVPIGKPKVKIDFHGEPMELEMTNSGLKLWSKGKITRIGNHHKFVMKRFMSKVINFRVIWPIFVEMNNEVDKGLIRKEIVEDLGIDNDDYMFKDSEQLYVAKDDIDRDGEEELLTFFQSRWFDRLNEGVFYLFKIKSGKVIKMTKVGSCIFGDFIRDQEDIGIMNDRKKGWKDLIVNDLIYVEANGKY